MGSWAESKLGELVDDETPNYRETKALLRMAIRETIEEAARRVVPDGNPALAKERILAMLTDETQRGGSHG